MNKKLLVGGGLLIVVVLIFSFVLMKGMGMNNLGLNNLSFSSVGVSTTGGNSPAVKECLPPVECGKTTIAFGHGEGYNQSDAGDAALSQCQETLDKARSEVSECLDKATLRCVDRGCDPGSNRGESGRGCMVDSCTHFYDGGSCTYTYDRYSGKVTETCNDPFQNQSPGEYWKCTASGLKNFYGKVTCTMPETGTVAVPPDQTGREE